MDWQRTAILGAMAAISFMLILEWKDFQDERTPVQEYAPTLASPTLPETDSPIPTPSSINNTDALTSAEDEEIPRLVEDTQDEPIQESQHVSAKLVTVTTDTLEVTIDTKGGDIIKVALLNHLRQLENPDQPFVLLNRTQNQTYIAQSGLIGENGTDGSGERPVFSAQQTSYRLDANEETLSVDLLLRQDGVDIIKRFVFTRGDHLIELNYLIDNETSTPWKAALYGQIKRDGTPINDTAPAMGIQPYLGAAISTPDENYKKLDFEDLADMSSDQDRTKRSFKTDKVGGWVAMVQHYFLSAWVPDQELNNHFQLRRSRNQEMYFLSFTSPATTVAPGADGKLKASFYVGPKDIDRLEAISPYLDLTVDYGWLWWIAKPLFHVLQWIYSYIGSWGWSIIALTIVIKAAFFQLSATSYKSMAKMRKVQPKMQELKDQYGDNRQKMSEELMKLYKKEKVNPLGGCLPILVQMPVFISLYWVLMESVELRHTPFLGWIPDLSVMDPYFILPLIMGATMWIQQKLNPTPPDPMQARIMQLMPVVFTILFLWFPAGLVLYWVVNNTLSITQQYIITKRIEAAD